MIKKRLNELKRVMFLRFSDEEYLRAWSEEGLYPKIHNIIYTLFSSTHEAESVVDLCCCTGLLGQHIKDVNNVSVVAVEGDEAWIERGKKWGTNVETLNLWVLPNTLEVFTSFLKEHKVTGITARRCISEIFGNDDKGRHLKEPNWAWAKIFTDAIIGAGVNEIWIEGRANQGRSTHCIPDTPTEAKCFSSGFKITEEYKTATYLTIK